MMTRTVVGLVGILLIAQGHAYMTGQLPSGLGLRGSTTAVSMSAQHKPIGRRDLLQVLAVAPALALPTQRVFAEDLTAEGLLKQWKEIGEKVKKQQDDLTEDEWKSIQNMLQRLTLSKSDVEALSSGLSASSSEKITSIATTMKFQAMAADEPAQLRDAVGFMNEYPSLEDSLKEIAELRRKK